MTTPRNHESWLHAYLEYARFTEAPRHMHFWCGVSAIAGALRRNVWIDQTYFKWFANFYIILVAPPGIVAKSTTLGISMDLLKEVPGIKFGPDVVTMASLVEYFANSKEGVEFQTPEGSVFVPTCALTLESSELGNLIDPNDKAMIDLLVSLWDGKPGTFTKATKHSGTDIIENPWINLIGCTTPSWIDGNFPEYMIGGGFTSRTIFVYADKKAQYIPYPGLVTPPDHKTQRDKLVHDLERIGELRGPFMLEPEAIEWGTAWYKNHYENRPTNLDPKHFGGYIARKQTQMHKLAMILSVSEGSSLKITKTHLQIADTMITDLESDLQFVFKGIGQSAESAHMERIIRLVHAKGSEGLEYSVAYRMVHAQVPDIREFEALIMGAVRAGYIQLRQTGTQNMIFPNHALPQSTGVTQTY